MKIRIVGLVLFASALLLTSCGGGGGGEAGGDVSASDPPPAGTAQPAPPTATGYLIDSPVQGVRYKATAQGHTVEGYTDSRGAFEYFAASGSAVSFSIGRVALGGSVEIIPAGEGVYSSKKRDIVTPFDLANDPVVRMNLLRTLQALNKRPDATSGIEISRGVDQRAEQWSIDFTTTDLAAALSLPLADAQSVDGVPHPLPDSDSALAHFGATMRCLNTGLYRGLYLYYDSLFTDTSYIGAFDGVLIPNGVVHGVLTNPPIVGGRDYSLLTDWFRSVVSTGVWSRPTTITGGRVFLPFGSDGLSYQFQWEVPRKIRGSLDSGAWGVTVDPLTGETIYRMKKLGSLIAGSATYSSDPGSRVLPLMRFAGGDTESGAATYLALDVMPDNSVWGSASSPANAMKSDSRTSGGDEFAQLHGSIDGDVISASGQTTSSGDVPAIELRVRATLDRQALNLIGSVTRATSDGLEVPYLDFPASRPLLGCIE